MVDDSTAFDVSAPRASSMPRLAEIAYFAFLLLIFVGLQPFAIRDATALTGAEAATGAGDALRQLAFASIFGLIVFASVRENGYRAFAAVPPVLALLLVWCLISSVWSPEPGISLRRAALESVIVLSAMMSASTLGSARSFQILGWVLAGVLVVNWCSIAVIHQAVHLSGDTEPQLVGDWRGLYFHKNIAGAVSAITAIVFFFAAWDRKRWIDIALCAAAIGFAVMTRSKSSLALLPVALAVGAIYRIAWHSTLDRLIVTVLVAITAGAGVAFLLADQTAVAQLFSDPKEFTGRAEIWQAELSFIRDHPYLGAGFGSFADTGTLSPLHDYVGGDWVNSVAHGHNAYLQLFVTIGGVGFCLALIGLVVLPLIAFVRENSGRVAEMAMPFAIFVFIVLHNLLESDFLEGDGPAWVAFLLVLAALGWKRAKYDPEPERAPWLM
jgi:exopolysaccharide production protein ExoQ